MKNSLRLKKQSLKRYRNIIIFWNWAPTNRGVCFFRSVGRWQFFYAYNQFVCRLHRRCAPASPEQSEGKSIIWFCSNFILAKPARSVGVAGIQTGCMRKKIVTDRPTDRKKHTPSFVGAEIKSYQFLFRTVSGAPSNQLVLFVRWLPQFHQWLPHFHPQFFMH